MSYSAQARIGAKASQLAGSILGKNSLYQTKGYTALTPTFQDDTLEILSANGVTTPALGSTVQFNLPKNSTLIGKCYVEITLSAGSATSDGATGEPAAITFNPDLAYNAATNFPVAEYNKNVGDVIVDNHTLIYGNTNLQNWDGRYSAAWRRVTRNDVNIEATNAQVLGGLSPGGDPNTGSERVLVDAYYRGVTLQCPLDELFFAHNRDEMWMPEAYALEGQLNHRLAELGQIVSTITRDGSQIAANQRPTITDIRLKYVEVTVSAAEKDKLLKLYRTPEGKVQHWYDLEFQKRMLVQGTGVRAPASALAAQPVQRVVLQLNNLRMDMAELVFSVNRVANRSPAADFPAENGVLTEGGFGGSVLEGDTTPSILFASSTVPGQGFSTLIDVSSLNVTAAGKSLYSSAHTGFWNRTHVRKTYHLDSQIVGAIYVVPFAQFPEDRKNATGHMSASVLGALQLELEFPNPGNTIDYEVTLYSKSHNLMQSRAGAVGKALN